MIAHRLSPGRTTTDSGGAPGGRRSGATSVGSTGGRGLALVGQPGGAMVGGTLAGAPEGQVGGATVLVDVAGTVLLAPLGDVPGEANAATGAARMPRPSAPATVRRRTAGMAMPATA